MAVAVLGATAFVARDVHRLDHVRKVQVTGQLAAPSTAGAETVLLVGTDRGLAAGQTKARADSILVARVDPAAGTETVVALSSSLRLPTATGGTTEELKDVFHARGPTGLLRALHEGLGIDVQHYVQVDPAGFAALVDALGGTKVRATRAVSDGEPVSQTWTGFSLPAGVCTTLDGSSALALARSRHIEAQDASGAWKLVDVGSPSRTARNEVLLAALLRSFRSLDVTNPVELHRLVGAFAMHATVDQSLDAAGIVRLARLLHNPAIQPRFAVLPITPKVDARSPIGYAVPGPGWQSVVAELEGRTASGPKSSAAATTALTTPGANLLAPCG